MITRSSLPIITLLACALAPAPADAYVRARTCDPLGLEGRPCSVGEESRQLYWPQDCVTYYVQRDGSDDFPRASRREASEELLWEVFGSFDTWSDPSCSSLRLVFGGQTCNQEVGLANDDVTGSMNVVMWRDLEWTHSSAAFGITTTTSNPNTGELLDADIELNGVHFVFASIQDEGDLRVDVRNTLTHEVGHLVGFAHENTIAEATMSPDANLGDVNKRDLHPDDLNGLCSVYPSATGEKPLCTPPAIQDDTCVIALEGQISCAQAPSPTPTHAPFWLLALCLACAPIGYISRRAHTP